MQIGIWNCDNVVRIDEKARNGHQNACLVFKKCKFLPSQYSVKWQQKLNFSEIIFKVDPTKRENAFEKLNHISFVTCEVTENPNIRVIARPMTRRKIDN